MPARDRRVGEIAPTYFASIDASERIARTLPQAKVVCVFRHPVERVISLYKLKRAYGMIPWNFEQALACDPEMLESSRYATRLKAWQHALGQEQVLATLYDDLRDKPQKFLDTIVDFIDVPRFGLSHSQTMSVHASETMTHPRTYHRTRRATTMADWFKARRLDRVVAAVRDSPLRKLFLGGGLPFAEFSMETSLQALRDLSSRGGRTRRHDQSRSVGLEIDQRRNPYRIAKRIDDHWSVVGRRQFLLDQGLHLFEHLILGQPGGIDHDSVRSCHQWGNCASSVAPVALAKFSSHGCGGGPFNMLLLEPALLTHHGVGVEEDFNVGIGKHLGADVAAFHDYATGESHFTLSRDHPLANLGMDGSAGSRFRDIALPDAG